jgi:hypothetical protein
VGFVDFVVTSTWILLPLDSMCSLVLHVSSCGFVFSCRGGSGGGRLHFNFNCKTLNFVEVLA